MSDFLFVLFDLLVVTSGRHVTAVLLPKSVRNSWVVHMIVGYALWIVGLIARVIGVRAIIARASPSRRASTSGRTFQLAKEIPS